MQPTRAREASCHPCHTPVSRCSTCATRAHRVDAADVVRSLEFWGFLPEIVVSQRWTRQSRKRQIYGGVAMFSTRHRPGSSLIRTFGEASQWMSHRHPRCAHLTNFDRRASPVQNDGNTPISASTVRAKLNLNTAVNIPEIKAKISPAQYRNGVDVQICVPDSPQVLLKPLRIGPCLFTARRPLS